MSTSTNLRKTKHKIAALVNFFILMLITLTMIYPIYFLTVSSFKKNTEYMVNQYGLPKQFTLVNFESLFARYNILRMTLNTTIVTVCAMIISAIINTLAGFIFAKLPYKGSDRIVAVIISCMAVPPIVLMIPVYLMMSRLGLVNNYLSLILIYSAMGLPFTLYLVTSNFRLIPSEFLESATIDGAGLFKQYYYIILPLGKPVILTLMALNFIAYWNELLFAMLLLQSNKMKTLTVGVATAIDQYEANMPLLMSGLLMNCVPVIAFFIFANRYLVRGLTAGALK